MGDFRQLGYEVIEGECLRSNTKHVSAPKEQRAAELMQWLLDDTLDAIAPPWGGELAIELLPLLDYDAIQRAKPKWLFGFSDVSTMTATITSKCGWATAHCANFMQLIATETDGLTRGTLKALQLDQGASFVQQSSEGYQEESVDFAYSVDATLQKTGATRWRSLSGSSDPIRFEGRLLGGCLDTIAHLSGTDYFYPEALSLACQGEPVIVYFENAELSPTALVRTLYGMRFRGVFDRVSGVLIGRSSAVAVDSAGFSYQEALASAFAGAHFPVVFDADIGHQPPNMTLINGCYATVVVEGGKGRVEQCFV